MVSTLSIKINNALIMILKYVKHTGLYTLTYVKSSKSMESNKYSLFRDMYPDLEYKLFNHISHECVIAIRVDPQNKDRIANKHVYTTPEDFRMHLLPMIKELTENEVSEELEMHLIEFYKDGFQKPVRRRDMRRVLESTRKKRPDRMIKDSSKFVSTQPSPPPRLIETSPPFSVIRAQRTGGRRRQ